MDANKVVGEDRMTETVQATQLTAPYSEYASCRQQGHVKHRSNKILQFLTGEGRGRIMQGVLYGT